MVVQNRKEWENGGNVVSLEQKRKELVERHEQERVESSLSGEDPSITVLTCVCGCDALVVYSDGASVFAQCIECGESMGWSLFNFMSGQD